jgi:hypothetical protein
MALNVCPARRCVRGQLNRAGQLGRQRHQPDVALGGLEKSVEGGNVGRQQVFCWLHPALGVRKKRAFQMNAEGPRLPRNGRTRQQFCQPGERPQGRIERRGDRGGQIAARAARGQKAAHRVESFNSGLHHVMAFGPVNMHIEKCRRQRCAGKM